MPPLPPMLPGLGVAGLRRYGVTILVEVAEIAVTAGSGVQRTEVLPEPLH
jgi:hypothetical protein